MCDSHCDLITILEPHIMVLWHWKWISGQTSRTLKHLHTFTHYMLLSKDINKCGKNQMQTKSNWGSQSSYHKPLTGFCVTIANPYQFVRANKCYRRLIICAFWSFITEASKSTQTFKEKLQQLFIYHLYQWNELNKRQ